MFALYKKNKDLYILNVSYEYGDSKFVGFNRNGEAYRIHKLNDEQRKWLETHNYREGSKTKNLIFIGDYYLSKEVFLPEEFPKGKPYTQLPGGGGVYKETRKYNFIYDLFKNPTIIKAIENYGTFNEGYSAVRKIIREMIENVLDDKISKNADNIEKNKLIGLRMLKLEASKYDTSEALLRS
ncbi:MAG: hypothetical protein WC197_09900, partial [Candidatus Gastranaerophilaceae bacterium]